ncbi:ParB-like nuclease domain-containing protein [Bartonella schoenbuchensis]|uniref:ParB-like nuclease domain-containing protein n=1 Tax=Bartonella schoenbuchensis TaxID=165694 RepID=UPI001ABA8DE7|nr:ParB-like nuclease domain-containing protein [Bartonella schoenbuchensis]
MVKIAKISLKKLKLDPENPRISASLSEKDATNSLCDTEQIVELAKDIAENGISPCEKFIVLQDGENYTVIEGNRRLIALKFLDNPNLTPERFFKKFSEYSANRKVRVNTVECMIVSNRKEANHWIETKHLGQNKGKGVKSWNAIQKACYFQSNPNRFAYLLFNHLLEGSSQYYNISNVMHFISKPIFYEYTGIDYDQEEDKLIFPSCEANSALDNCLKQFVQDILEEKIDSHTHNSKQSIEQYFEILFRKFKLSKVYSRNDARKSKNKKETKHSEKQYSLFKNDANKDENCQKQKLSCYDEEIASLLNKLSTLCILKPAILYSSVKKLKSDSDTPLLYVAFSCLFEWLTGLIGRPDKETFDSFLKNHPLLETALDMYMGENKRATLDTLKKIRDNANIVKHANLATPLTYLEIANDMQLLKPLLMQLINAVYKK